MFPMLLFPPYRNEVGVNPVLVSTVVGGGGRNPR